MRAAFQHWPEWIKPARSRTVGSVVALVGLASATGLGAASSSASYNVQVETLNASGGASSSAGFSNLDSLGEIGGLSMASSPAVALADGFIGTLGPVQPPQTFTWTGAASQDWFNSMNWNPASGVPGPADIAIINSGSVNIASNTAVGTVFLNGGTLSGSGALLIAFGFQWSAGTMSETGATTLLPGAVGILSGTSTKALSGGRVLQNQGTVTVNGDGNLSLSHGSVILNSGLFEFQSDADITFGGQGPTPGFTNLAGATVRKSTASGVTQIGGGVAFYNGGQVEIQAGTLELLGGGGGNSGNYVIAGGRTLRYVTGTFNLSGNTTFQGGGLVEVSFANVSWPGLVSITGAGTTLRNSGGTLDVGGTTTLGAGTVFELTSGTLAGTGALALNGSGSWTGGTMNNSGGTTVAGGALLALDGDATKALSGGRVFQNQGTVTVNGDGNLSLSHGSVILNSGLFEFQSDADITFGGQGPTPGFTNLAGATVRKSTASGVTQIGGSVVFQNHGQVDIRSGIISIENNYAPAATSRHRFTLGGLSAGTGFGKLTISGKITLAGTLELALTNSYLPAMNDTFQIISANSRLGTFAGVTGQDIGGGKQLAPIYQTDGVSLLVTKAPPKLKIEQSGGSLSLTWPAEQTNVQVEAAEDPVLGPWKTLTLPSTNRFDIITTNALEFYRLKLP